ncbi:MAG TPA: glutaredoxin [Thermoproteales archaeon]|nr:glutaredoxin [Thermoproteales archaeon]
MSELLDEATRKEVRMILANMKGEVILKFIKPKGECKYCDLEEEILEIISSLAPENKIKLKKVSFDEASKKYNVDLAPALLIHSPEKEYGVRFFGIPAGYEFGALIEDIVDVSRDRVEVDEETQQIIKIVDKPVRIKIFVTPTCPYCPLAVRAAHKFAILNNLIYGDMIEALEFPELADSYGVYAVPKVVINDVIEFEGAIPEKFFALAVAESIGKKVGKISFKELYRELTGEVTRTSERL